MQSAPLCGSEPGHDWWCWGWWRFACCARRYEGLSTHGPCRQRTPALLLAKATCSTTKKKKEKEEVLKVSLLSVLAALRRALLLFVSQKSRPVQNKAAEWEGWDHGIVIIFCLRKGFPTCATSHLELSVLDRQTVSKKYEIRKR